ncbi:MAG: hybrid sensor histidine kinase/response regulator [Anaerolineales bacterium]|nr:hybrid sensor histidine kinase/response regulator [Anaerolineales bacterium]
MSASKLILLAVTHEQLQRLFQSALGAVSYQVAIANERLTLERVLREAIPDLLIIAQHFDGISGLDVAQDLLERFPTLPIILFAEEETPSLLKRAIQIGISDYLSPPLRIETVMRSVEESLRRANRLGDWTRREVRRTTASLQKRVDELQKFYLILNAIEDGVLILDDHQRVLFANAAARRMFGIWQEEAIAGKPVSEAISNVDLMALLSTDLHNVLPHNEIAFDDGRVLSAQLVAIPKVGTAITFQDISYWKQIDRLKSEFIHAVSHDLRSPLTAILGYIDLVERVGPLTEQQREFILRVQQNVQGITLLLNELLELGRIEAGLDTQKELVCFEEIVRQAYESLEVQARMRSQRITLSLPDQPSTLRGNPIRLRQMLDNLIGNAIKYTPEGGEISVQLEVQNNQLILRVRDTGPGIPPADQPHIFNKFYRASNVPRGVGGTGLGLAIVKSIVDNHGGRIWVDSVLGKGSTFTVVLPYEKKE